MNYSCPNRPYSFMFATYKKKADTIMENHLNRIALNPRQIIAIATSEMESEGFTISGPFFSSPRGGATLITGERSDDSLCAYFGISDRGITCIVKNLTQDDEDYLVRFICHHDFGEILHAFHAAVGMKSSS